MNLAEFHFIRPYWLLALLPYLILLVLLLKKKLHQGNWSQVCDSELLPYILQQHAVTQSRWPFGLGAFAALLCIIALAGPTWARLPAPVFRNDAALVIALDLSASMNAADIKPSRLVRARYKIADILNRRKDGQTALLVYAGDVFTVAPLTDDTETIQAQLNALNTDIMPVQGSNTALALEKAVHLFKQAGLQNGQILLITDGVEDEQAMDQAEKLNPYSLSVLAVGTSEGAPIQVPGGGFLKDRQGNIVIPKLDQTRLRHLASIGGGSYQLISANDSDIEHLLKAIDRQALLEQSEQQSDLLLEQWQEQGPWLLLLVLPLTALLFRRGAL